MKRFPLMLAVAAALAMVVPAFAQVGSRPAKAPPVDAALESQLEQSPTIVALKREVAELKSARGGVNIRSASLKVSCHCTADGRCVAQVCDETGCREVPCECSCAGAACATPNASASFGAPTATYGQPVFFGDCSTGNCGGGLSFGAPMMSAPPMFMGGGGGCASGNCGGGGGGRGRRGR